MTSSIRFRLNGKPVTLETDEDRTLLWVLRTDLGLTGTKYGCGEGVCGSCTVVVDGEAVRSCQTSLEDVQGKDVVTSRGSRAAADSTRCSRRSSSTARFQCGYCTPGMLMNAYALLLKNPKPSRARRSRRAWRTTSAAAAPTSGSSPRSKTRRGAGGRP